MTPRRRAVTGSIAVLAFATLAGGQYAGATTGATTAPSGGQSLTMMIAVLRARRDPSRAGGDRRLAAGVGQQHPS